MASPSMSTPTGNEPVGAGSLDDARLTTLLRRSAAGDHEAFAELYEATAPRVYGVVLRIVRDQAQAAEVVQDCYLQVWQQSVRYRTGQGTVRAWLIMLAHRRAVDRVRSSQATIARDELYATREPRPNHDTVGDGVADKLEAERVREALGGLTDLQRSAIELAFLGGRTQSEVADALDIPLGTAKTRLRDGLLRLRRILEEDR